MFPEIDRRMLLKGAAGAGLMGLLGGCGAKVDGVPVRIVSSQGPQVLTIQKLMEQKGWFKAFGIAPDVMPVASGTNLIGPLIAGKADICIFAGFSQLLAAIDKGAKLKILGGASIKGQQALYAKDPAIRTVKDLEGRSVGVGAIGAQLHQVVTALLKKKGVDVDKVKFVVVGNSGDVFRAVVAGRVDAGNGQADVRSSLGRLHVHMIEDGDYAAELPEYTWQAAFTSINAIKENRDGLVRTLGAYCKAFRYVQNPGSEQDFIQAQMAALSPRNQEQGIEAAKSQWNYLQQRKIYDPNLILTEERVDYMQELNLSLGVQKKKIPYTKLFDTSLAEEAVAKLG